MYVARYSRIGMIGSAKLVYGRYSVTEITMSTSGLNLAIDTDIVARIKTQKVSPLALSSARRSWLKAGIVNPAGHSNAIIKLLNPILALEPSRTADASESVEGSSLEDTWQRVKMSSGSSIP